MQTIQHGSLKAYQSPLYMMGCLGPYKPSIDIKVAWLVRNWHGQSSCFIIFSQLEARHLYTYQSFFHLHQVVPTLVWALSVIFPFTTNGPNSCMGSSIMTLSDIIFYVPLDIICKQSIQIHNQLCYMFIPTLPHLATECNMGNDSFWDEQITSGVVVVLQ